MSYLLLIFNSPSMRQEMGLPSFFSMEAQEMISMAIRILHLLVKVQRLISTHNSCMFSFC